MILAAIDTSTRFAGVGVMDAEGGRATHTWRSNQNHGRELMPALMRCFTELSLVPTEVTHVAVALGPGGFSAVRVGISVALGLVTAKKLPVLGIPSHAIEVEPYRELIVSGTPVYSLLPAGRQEVSWMRHDATLDSSEPEARMGVASPAEFANRLDSGALVCGEACDLVVGLLEESQFARFQEPGLEDPGIQRETRFAGRDPNSILDMAVASFTDGTTTPYEELRPIYARPPSISRPKPAK